MLKPVEEARHSYAAELRFTAKMRSSALVNAFATVPREQFVGPGPWRIKSPMDLAEYWTTDDDDPSQVYHDVLIALDESRGINNGQPSLWAYLRCSCQRLMIAKILQCSKLNLLGQSRKALDGGRNKDT
jgi:protein-L-isoaspartate(D-aspartate) O-methyltransferase